MQRVAYQLRNGPWKFQNVYWFVFIKSIVRPRSWTVTSKIPLAGKPYLFMDVANLIFHWNSMVIPGRCTSKLAKLFRLKTDWKYMASEWKNILPHSSLIDGRCLNTKITGEKGLSIDRPTIWTGERESHHNQAECKTLTTIDDRNN